MKKIIFILCNLLIISKLSLAQSVSLAPTIPASPTKGTVVYNNSTNQLQYWNGTAWIPITNAAAATGWTLSGSNIYSSNTGNVGIGSSASSPRSKIQIGSLGANSSTFTGFQVAMGDGTSTSAMGFLQNPSYSYWQSSVDIILWPRNGAGTGYVGINSQTYPSNQLEIGSIGSTGFTGYQLALGNGTNAFAISQNNATTVLANTTDIVLRPRNNGTGYVGISADSPTNKLQIGAVTNAFVGNDLAIGNGTNTMSIYQSNASTKISSTTDIYLNPRNNGAGRVGINTETPRGPLEVAGNVVLNLYYRYYNEGNFLGGGYTDNCDPCNANVSIYASNAVYGAEFDAYSDARIKDIVGVSNSAKDLETIKALQITDYTMKDKIKNGNKPFKKVIAQQVEKFYPQAVNKSTEVVPDIYALAEKVVFNETNKTLTCSLSNSYDIKVGEKIEFIHEKEGKIKAEVVEVSGNSFTVKDWKFPTDKIFVYGREVNDFRTVDYEAISMLGISAIQELAKENEELKSKLKNYESRLEAIEATLRQPTGK